VRFLTNNPKKIVGLDGYGLSVAEQVPLSVEPNPHNEEYLRTKRDKLGHLFPPEEGETSTADGQAA
jgi:3,4-dihydroxy 2-butanone 4-phosphate synthase/GTP cyclohydrolase II